MRQTAIDCNNSYIDPYIFEPASLVELGIFYGQCGLGADRPVHECIRVQICISYHYY
jgi:hypothetical protein